MKSAKKHTMIAIVAAISLSGLLVNAWADDVASPPVAAPNAELTAPELTLAPKPDKWNFTSPVLFWFPAVKGSIEAKGRTADVDLDMGDVANHTDLGWVAFFDLSKNRFGVYVQPNYMKLSGDAKSGPVKADLETQLWIVETAAHYTFWEWQGDYHGSLMALAGLRWWQMHNELTFKDPGGKVSGGSTKSLYDPIIGLRYQQYFTEKFHVWLQGDIGGFGLGQDTSRFAWQVWPLLGYDFTMPVIKKPSTFFAGYRLLDSQKVGSGGNSYHLLFHGVTVGFNVVLF
jgi:hypothetical protein